MEQGGKHEAGAGEKVEGAESGSQPFVVAGQTATSGGPGEASLHHPALWQQHKTSFGFHMLHDFKLDAMLFGSFGCITLVYIGELDMLTGQFLHLPGQFAELDTVLATVNEKVREQ